MAKGAVAQLKKNDHKNRNIIEKGKLEEDFSLEIKNFSEHWEEKIGTYQQECNKMENELLAANQEAIDSYKKELEETIPVRSKDSSKLLEAKSQLEQLVRIEEFKDAHYLQQRCFELEKAEQERYQVERSKKIETLLEQKISQQQNEYNALRKRILNGLDELEIQRKNEYDRLFLKYNNLKKNIESHQTMQSYVLEKSLRAESIKQSMSNFNTQSSNKRTTVN